MGNINLPKEKPFEVREKEPDMIIMLTRHVERLPDGSVTPEGLQRAAETGESLRGVGIYKPYASSEKSGRTVATGKAIAEASETKSPLTGEAYRPHKVRDIDYSVVQEEFPQHFKKAKDLIETATLEELGLPIERDSDGKIKMTTDKYPKKEQIKIAPTRQKNQAVGIRYLLEQPEMVQRMAICIAHQLVERMKVTGEYMDRRERPGEKGIVRGPAELKKPVVPGINSHGAFFESFLKRAGVVRKEDGLEEPIADPASDEFGGIINPNESFKLVIKDRKNIPDKIPVEFLGAGRPKAGTVFIDKNKLCDLAEDYIAWTMTPEYQKDLHEEIIKDKARVADKYIKSINA